MTEILDKKFYQLGKFEKAASFVGSGLLLIGTLSLLYLPPKVQRFAPNADSDGEPASISYEVPWQLPVSLILGAAGLLIFAINGRRISNAKGLEFEKVPDPKKQDLESVAADKQDPTTKSKQGPPLGGEPDATTESEQEPPLSGEPNATTESKQEPPLSYELSIEPTKSIGELGVFALEDLPLTIVQELAKRGLDLGHSTLRDFHYALRKRQGSGNHPWYFRFENRTRLQKLTMGGQGKSKPTWTEVVAT